MPPSTSPKAIMTDSPRLTVDTGHDKACHVSETEPCSCKLREFGQLPPLRKAMESPFIHKHYRHNMSYRQALSSLWYCHNESMNVWSHFCGCLGFLCLMIVMLSTLDPHGYAHWKLAPVSARNTSASSLPDVGSCCGREFYEWDGDHDDDGVCSLSEYDDFLAMGCVPCCHDRWSFAANRTFELAQDPQLLQRLSKHLPDVHRVVDALRGNAQHSEFDTFAVRVRHAMRALQEEATKLARGVEDEVSAHTTIADILRHHVGDFIHHLDRQEIDTLGVAEALIGSDTHPVDVDHHSTKVSLREQAMQVMGLPSVDVAQTYPEGVAAHGYLARWPIVVYIISLMCCLSGSTIFHLFTALRYDLVLKYQQLDFAGISLLLLGSGVPIIYYGFYCDEFYRSLYFFLYTGAGMMAFAAAVSTWVTRIGRVYAFVSHGVSGGLIVLHLCLVHGYESKWEFGAMAFFYLAGAAIYATRVPERCFPGHFDLSFSSHNLWHLFIILAAASHYQGIIKHYHWRLLTPCNG